MKKKILIVEDERIVAEDIKRTLKKLGYSVTSIVSSGKEAIQKVDKDKPDLILMDIVLRGDMDGITTAEHIHSKCGLPVIYLTAYADQGTVQRAKVAEPYGYIVKRFCIPPQT